MACGVGWMEGGLGWMEGGLGWMAGVWRVGWMANR